MRTALLSAVSILDFIGALGEASGWIGEHNHRGPGIRRMTEGEMDCVMPHATVTYRPGDFFFETGDVSHRVLNDTQSDSKHLLFEILPLDVEGPSLIPPGESAPG